MSAGKPPHRGGPPGLTPGDDPVGLRDALHAARNLIDRLRADPLLLRLLETYTRMPAEDREVIVGILAREVDLRCMAKPARRTPINGVALTRPNPNARLYMRMHDATSSAPYVSREEMMHAMLRAARAMHLTLATTAHWETWETGVRDALDRLPHDQLDAVAWVHRRMLGLAERARDERQADERSAAL